MENQETKLRLWSVVEPRSGINAWQRAMQRRTYFCNAMDAVIGYDLEPHVFVYMDDIIIMSEDFDHHLYLIAEIFKRLNNAGFKANSDKSQFCRESIEFLGMVLSEEAEKAFD